MKSMHLIPALSLLVPAIAYAQPESVESTTNADYVPPVERAFELGVAAGYTQGAGPVGGASRHLEDLSNAGGAVEVDLGFRATPNLVLGGYGTLASFQHGDTIDQTGNVVGATAGVQAGWHFRPDRTVDPWVKLGTGWKGLWLDPDQGKTTSLQGLELARLQLGVDYRASRDVSISPVVGGSLGMFLSEDSPMTTSYQEIDTKKVNFTGFAGVAGTFDLGGR
jgi:hypothetical protein